ncbi:MAG TPA: LptE family protein [Tepidisphaeraceae bacterium]|nr:LptE family protein [Tepidisphaeraceae bacterium]
MNSPMLSRAIRIAMFVGICLAQAGCGYDQTTEVAGYQWRSLYPANIRTVAVPTFTNRTFKRGYEFQITDAVIHEIEAFTPYKVVSRDHADTILEGEVVSVNVQPVNISPETATPNQQLLEVAIDFTWKDLRSGKILAERRNFAQTESYYPSLGESSWVGEQSAAQGLAAGIVHEMEAPW